jgi:hypothetical protein
VTELEYKAVYRPYFFHQEYVENERSGSSPRSDIAVQAHCAGGKRFLVLEAKRLPTPGTGREYIEGKSGGVERFKRGDHGRELRTVGMIGYVQRKSFAFWQDALNGWIDELIASPSSGVPWDEQDKLIPETASERLATLRSSNLRVTDEKRLKMRHLWVQLALPEPALGAKI